MCLSPSASTHCQNSVNGRLNSNLWTCSLEWNLIDWSIDRRTHWTCVCGLWWHRKPGCNEVPTSRDQAVFPWQRGRSVQSHWRTIRHLTARSCWHIAPAAATHHWRQCVLCQQLLISISTIIQTTDQLVNQSINQSQHGFVTYIFSSSKFPSLLQSLLPFVWLKCNLIAIAYLCEITGFHFYRQHCAQRKSAGI